jgi:hypothetical protein
MHTVQVVIEWPRLLHQICPRAVWFFDVPIGDSGIRTSYTLPHFPVQLAAERCMSHNSSCGAHLAKLLVYTLRGEGGAQAEAAGGMTTPQQAIETFCSLLEHYFHPNTAGRCALLELSACV